MQSTHPAAVPAKGSVAWLNVIAGGLLFIAPWVLGYSANTAALANHLILGALAAVVALLAATVHRN